MLERPSIFFFFNDTATTEIYTLSLHDALPIFAPGRRTPALAVPRSSSAVARLSSRGNDASTTLRYCLPDRTHAPGLRDRKSTRLNSSHANISYAVFCLKKKKLVCSILHLKTYN